MGKRLRPLQRSAFSLDNGRKIKTGERYERLKVSVGSIPVDAEVYNGRIWRISVTRLGLRTQDGSQVGDSVQKLLRANRSLCRELGPGPSLVLIPERFCGISYTTDADLPESVMQNPSSKLLTRFAKATRIRWIFVTGCKAQSVWDVRFGP